MLLIKTTADIHWTIQVSTDSRFPKPGKNIRTMLVRLFSLSRNNNLFQQSDFEDEQRELKVDAQYFGRNIGRELLTMGRNATVVLYDYTEKRSSWS